MRESGLRLLLRNKEGKFYVCHISVQQQTFFVDPMSSVTSQSNNGITYQFSNSTNTGQFRVVNMYGFTNGTGLQFVVNNVMADNMAEACLKKVKGQYDNVFSHNGTYYTASSSSMVKL